MMPALVDTVASRCTEVESGARNVDNILTNTLLPDISRQLLGRMAEGEKVTALHVRPERMGLRLYLRELAGLEPVGRVAREMGFMPSYTQEDRLFKIDTPLGDNALLLKGFRGAEGISRLFRFELDLLSENNSISFADIVGKSVTISLKQADGSHHCLNG